jgi:hypothetical protein
MKYHQYSSILGVTDFHLNATCRGGIVNFPMLVPTFQLGHMSNLVYISDAVMVEGPFEPLRG